MTSVTVGTFFVLVYKKLLIIAKLSNQKRMDKNVLNYVISATGSTTVLETVTTDPTLKNALVGFTSALIIQLILRLTEKLSFKFLKNGKENNGNTAEKN